GRDVQGAARDVPQGVAAALRLQGRAALPVRPRRRGPRGAAEAVGGAGGETTQGRRLGARVRRRGRGPRHPGHESAQEHRRDVDLLRRDVEEVNSFEKERPAVDRSKCEVVTAAWKNVKCVNLLRGTEQLPLFAIPTVNFPRGGSDR